MREIRLLTETSTQIHISAWPKAHPLPFQRGAKNNYRNSVFWQVFPSQYFGMTCAPVVCCQHAFRRPTRLLRLKADEQSNPKAGKSTSSSS
jgi:hypothetical protein